MFRQKSRIFASPRVRERSDSRDRANSGEREFPHASCFSIRGDTPTPTLPREEREREKGTRFRGSFSFCDSE
jgi:hypothetical protein